MCSAVELRNMYNHVIEAHASGYAWAHAYRGYIPTLYSQTTGAMIWRSQVRIPTAQLSRHLISLGKELPDIDQVNSASSLNGRKMSTSFGWG